MLSSLSSPVAELKRRKEEESQEKEKRANELSAGTYVSKYLWLWFITVQVLLRQILNYEGEGCLMTHRALLHRVLRNVFHYTAFIKGTPRKKLDQMMFACFTTIVIASYYVLCIVNHILQSGHDCGGKVVWVFAS